MFHIYFVLKISKFMAKFEILQKILNLNLNLFIYFKLIFF